MSKPFINTMIKHLVQSGLTTKVSPWLNEGTSTTSIAAIRYVGLKPDSSWNDVLSSQDNLLLKFTIIDKISSLSVLLANRPPFIELSKFRLNPSDTWEQLLGKTKQRLKKESAEFHKGESTVANLYRQIKPYLK